MNCSLPGSSVHGIFQARIQKWVAISFSKRSSWPRNQTHICCIASRFYTAEPWGKSFHRDIHEFNKLWLLSPISWSFLSRNTLRSETQILVFQRAFGLASILWHYQYGPTLTWTVTWVFIWGPTLVFVSIHLRFSLFYLESNKDTEN